MIIKHTFKYIIIPLIALVLVVLTLFVMTPQGLTATTRMVTYLSSGRLLFSGTSGSFNQPIHFDDIHYNSDTVSIDIEDVDLRWQPLYLAVGKISVPTLNIKRIHIVPYNDPNKKANSPPSWHMLFKLYLNDINIGQIVYGENTPTVLNNFQGQLIVGTDSLQINKLLFNKENLFFNIQGLIDLSPINTNLTINVAEAKQTKFSASFNAQGSWNDVITQINIATPFKLESTAEIHNVYTDLSWKLKGNLEPFYPFSDGMSYEGNFNGQGTLKELSIDSNFNSTSPIAHNQLKLNITSNDLAHRKYQASGTLTTQHKNFPDTNTLFSAIGDMNQLSLKQLDISTLDGHLLGSGSLNLKTKRYDFILTANHLHPEKEWPDWAGNINAQIHLFNQGALINFELTQLTGTLRNQTLTGFLNATGTPKRLQSLNTQLNYGLATLDIVLKNKISLNAQWNINIPTLAMISPIGSGALNSTGSITGSQETPVIKGMLKADHFIFENYAVENLETAFNIDLHSTGQNSLSFTGTNLSYNNLNLSNLNINANGTTKSHHIEITASNATQSLDLVAQGNYNNGTWNSSVSKLSWSNVYHTWGLKNPFTLIYSSSLFSIHSFAWQADQAQAIQMNVDWARPALPTGSLIMNNINLDNLDNFDALLPAETKWTGRLNLNASDIKNNLLFNLSVQNAVFSYVGRYNIPVQSLNYTLNYSDKSNQQGLFSNLAIFFSDNNFLNATLNLPNYKLGEPFNEATFFKGNLDASIIANDIDFFAGKIKSHFKFEGTLNQPHVIGAFHLTDGSLTLPQQGLTLANINADISAGQNNNLNYKAHMSSGKGILNVDGSTSFDTTPWQTSLHIQGNNFTAINTAAFNVVTSPDVNLTLKGNRTDLTGKIIIPFADIRYNNYNDVVTLPSDITIISKNTLANSNALLNDFYSNLTLVLENKVHIDLGSIAGDVTGQLLLNSMPNAPTLATGQLTITDGYYKVFGQTLTITNGKLLYTNSPTDNPGLDVHGTKTIITYVNPTQNLANTNSILAYSNNDSSSVNPLNIQLQQQTIVVGVSATNTLLNPNLTLYSNQGYLTQADILSYLILGTPLSQVNGQQAQAIAQAASALSGNNSGELDNAINKLKTTFKIDQIGLQSNNYFDPSSNTIIQNTSLVLGKMLAPRLFVSYSIGLLSPINTITASYQINQYLSAQTENNSLGTGADLVYSFEH
jgi:translocation and assembly module TamB